MLVSHLRKFIFLKTVKTASTSVEIYLQPYCTIGSSDNADAIRQPTPELVSEAGIVGARGSYRGARFNGHEAAAVIREAMGDEIWRTYLKVTCIRNPFDRVVSAFWFFVRPDADAGLEAVRTAFRDYVRGGVRDKLNAFTDPAPEMQTYLAGGPPEDRNIFTLDGVPCCDVYIRYESLQTDLQLLCERLGLAFQPQRLGRYKSEHRSRSWALSEYYDDETIACVRSMYAPEFGWFGYDDRPVD